LLSLLLLADSLGYAGYAQAVATLVAERERVGVGVIWVSEAYGFDVPKMLGYMVARTGTLQIGTGIVNAFTPNGAVIAQTFAGLGNLSGGRAISGLGASGLQVSRSSADPAVA
jgi:alkanesulfonate monooxygenase SsuD/methylene tetrahydromethanopterin reductase-like flavin-dependent oxidoreductase (luciferase family)